MWSGLETTIWTGRGASGDDTSAYKDMLAVALSMESAWEIESHQKWMPAYTWLDCIVQGN